MDHSIGRLVALLSELAAAETTLIVPISDNGGCTVVEGTVGGRSPANNGPFRGGVITLEEFIGNPKGRNVPALTKRFKQLNSNGDDKLQLDKSRKTTR